jgi:hypothetical protein
MLLELSILRNNTKKIDGGMWPSGKTFFFLICLLPISLSEANLLIKLMHSTFGEEFTKPKNTKPKNITAAA